MFGRSPFLPCSCGGLHSWVSALAGLVVVFAWAVPNMASMATIADVAMNLVFIKTPMVVKLVSV